MILFAMFFFFRFSCTWIGSSYCPSSSIIFPFYLTIILSHLSYHLHIPFFTFLSFSPQVFNTLFLLRLLIIFSLLFEFVLCFHSQLFFISSFSYTSYAITFIYFIYLSIILLLFIYLFIYSGVFISLFIHMFIVKISFIHLFIYLHMYYFLCDG